MKLYRLECVDGGFGWGETGQEAEMCAPSEEFVKQNIPGGWTYKLVGDTTENFFLRHL